MTTQKMINFMNEIERELDIHYTGGYDFDSVSSFIYHHKDEYYHSRAYGADLETEDEYINDIMWDYVDNH